MNETNQQTTTSNRPARPFQFSLQQLLLLPVWLGLYLGIFIWWYPYSISVIPVLLIVSFFVALLSRNIIVTIIISAVVFVIFSLFLAGITDPREFARKSACQNQIKQISIAFHSYYDKNGHFPPAYIVDKDGRPMHSWRVLILPYMEHDDVYKQYRMDEPWDGPNNRKLWSIKIPEYECPEQPDLGKPTTSYVAVVGPGTMWPGSASTRFEDIRDGASQTIAVVEIADSGIHWMEPRDLDISTLPMTINPKDVPGIFSLHRSVSWQRQRLGSNVEMADGHNLFLPNDFPADKLKAMLTIAGGDKVEEGEQ